MKNAEWDTYYAKACRFCAGAEHCRQEIARKLEGWQVPEAQREQVLQRLEEEGYIEERRYATAFVQDKARFNGWGVQKIRYALRSKGIDEAKIADALSTLDETAHRERLRRLLQTKARSLHESDPYQRQSKLLRFAASRGYDPELVLHILREQQETPT